MFLKKLLIVFVLFGTWLNANNCPKWFPVPYTDGLHTIAPIYKDFTDPDMDCDGLIDSIDKDIDGDGVENELDAFPLDASETIDTDGDGIGDNEDTDDDNDGIIDREDAFPIDSTKSDSSIFNIEVVNITGRSYKVTWEGNPYAKTWLYVHELKTTGLKHQAINNNYIYISLGENYTFTLFVQGKGENIAKEIIFSTSKQNDNNSIYLEQIKIPKYDADNPTHVLITTENGMWRSSVLNNSDNKHFYIKAGKYTTKINLTASGNKNNRRTMSLYNGNDTHPAALSDDMVADVKIGLNNASYWLFDRISSIDSVNLNQAISINGLSSNNIFNRFLISNFNNGIELSASGDNNIIQNSSFRNMNLYAPDGVAIVLTYGSNKETMYSIKNTKIINNEFYNCNDSIQLARRNRPSDGEYQDANYEGTIIDNNIMYIDSAIYTDGKGNLNANGFFALAENAIDIKAGSENLNNPVMITNNKIWGYRKSDNLMNGARSDHGAAIVIHFGTKNIKIQNNIIFDSAQAIVSGAKDRFNFSLGYSEITGNIFYNVGSFIETDDPYPYGAIMIWEGKNILFSKNTIVNARVKSMWSKATVSNVSFIENVIINSDSPYNETPTKNIFNYNYYYNTLSNSYALGKNDKMYDSDNKAKMSHYIFTYERFFTEPKQKTLKDVITTEDSQHYSKAGSTIR